MSTLRLVCISDTHGGHRRLEVPDGDILIHAGDITHAGSLETVGDFDDWLADLPHPTKVVIAGNHDWSFQNDPDESRRLLTHATYLEDEAREIDGLVYYGTPWTPRFRDLDEPLWAFDALRGEALAAKWEPIPETVDILITHSPPHGVRDEIYTGEAIGCEDLRRRVEQVRPDLHVFGHVHENPGVTRLDDTLHLNAVCPGGYGHAAVLDYDPATGDIEVVEPGDELPDFAKGPVEPH